jgi:hypothetical protein
VQADVNIDSKNPRIKILRLSTITDSALDFLASTQQPRCKAIDINQLTSSLLYIISEDLQDQAKKYYSSITDGCEANRMSAFCSIIIGVVDHD